MMATGSAGLRGGAAGLFGGAALLLAVALCAPRAGETLPQYTARSGRNCANCHMEPTGWTDPPLAERLCTLSCAGCHVDPAGGGLRTVSGLYYGTQLLPSFGAPLRPWEDRAPHLFGLLPPRNAEDEFDPSRWPEFRILASTPPSGEDATSQPTSMATSQPTSQPTSMATSQPTSQPSGGGAEERAATEVSTAPDRAPDRAPDGPLHDLLAWGRPAGERSVHVFGHDRYGGLNADPLLRLGVDARYAAYRSPDGWVLFPMQLDIGAALHPVEHLSVVGELAAWGSQTGVGTQVAGEELDLFGLHEAFVMTHEWPFNSYLKVGRFSPQFGTRLDDHTAFVRRNLGLDHSRPSAWVSGAELGFNANYPYAAVGVFRTGAGQHAFWPEEGGEGVSAVLGWRELAWGAGLSGWASGSPIENRQMLGATWYLNPWRLWPAVPLTYLGELDWVSVDRGEGVVQQLAAFHELDWLILNGVNLRLRYDFFDANIAARDDHQHRLNVQMDFFPVRFLELQAVLRQSFAPAAESESEILLIGRGWM
jgi:hypothetical protein